MQKNCKKHSRAAFLGKRLKIATTFFRSHQSSKTTFCPSCSSHLTKIKGTTILWQSIDIYNFISTDVDSKNKSWFPVHFVLVAKQLCVRVSLAMTTILERRDKGWAEIAFTKIIGSSTAEEHKALQSHLLAGVKCIQHTPSFWIWHRHRQSHWHQH